MMTDRQKLVQVRLVLKPGNWVQVLLPLDEARGVLDSWVRGTLVPIIHRIADPNPALGKTDWGIKTEDITAIYIMEEFQDKPPGGA